MRLAIVDDCEKECEAIADTVREWASKRSIPLALSTFPSAESYLFEYRENNIFDILLLDVEMKRISGIELAKTIRQKDTRAEIVFITSHIEFVSEGYEVDALHYLIKPVPVPKLCSVLDKARDRLMAEPPTLLFECEGEMINLPEDDILYMESSAHYLLIYTKDRDYRIKGKLSEFAKKLSPAFFKLHRSYLASLKHIVRIARNEVTLSSGKVLPLARGLYDDINRAFIEQN